MKGYWLWSDILEKKSYWNEEVTERRSRFNVPASFEVSSILMGQTLIIQIGIIKVYYYIQAT